MRGRPEALILVFVLLLASAPALALPTPSPGPFLPRAPIAIFSDADFTAANGVIGGTGAPGDPFVIAGWSITATTSTAIRIHNVTAAFLVRDNAIDAKVGIHVTASAAVGVLQNNKLIVRGTGVLVQGTDAHVVDNSFIGGATSAAVSTGVELQWSNSLVESNAFVYLRNGVKADRGSPSIHCNDLHDDVIQAGIFLTGTTNASVSCNTITQCWRAMRIEHTIGTVIANNSITSCSYGIELVISKDVDVRNNTIRASSETQLYLDIVSGNLTGNAIVDGRVGGMVIVRSPVLIANNTISNHLGVGLTLMTSPADVHGNLVASNSIGISLEGGSVPWLTTNVMVNNTVGINIPYASRQAIVNMSANVVNGVNIDGTLDASQRVYFYKAANVSISGQVRDSGFSAGYYGALTAQGGVVLYEVTTAHVNASVISHHHVGVLAVNSFNVNVQGSLLFDNLVGVRAGVDPTGGPLVPNCAVSVKDTNITIPQDPVLTLGIDVRSCVAVVGRVEVSIVDTGVSVDGGGQLTLFDSTITSTRIGLDAQGKPLTTNVSGNVLAGNRIGARFSGSSGIVQENHFQGNAEVGVRLENAAALDFFRNNVSENGEGLVDMEACAGPLTCSTVDARGNVFLDNDGDGARIRGASTWLGDAAVGNRGDGFDLGSARLRDVLAIGNWGDGARVLGDFDVEGSLFEDNEADGLDVVGGGELRNSTFARNDQSGIRMAPTYVWGLHLEIRENFDGILLAGPANSLGSPTVPPLSLPGLLPFIWEGGSVGPLGVTLDVHRSSFVANERDAIRGGGDAVNATHNWFGRATGPALNVADTLGAFQNGVSPTTRFVPYYTDAAMTTTGPVPLL
jgi:parallel beta-helix repeat protein